MPSVPSSKFLVAAVEGTQEELPSHEFYLRQHVENQKEELLKYQAQDEEEGGIAMSAAVLEAAQNVAQELQDLQFVYIRENMKAGKSIEEIAVANKAWGQFRVFDTLLGKLRGDVASEADQLVKQSNGKVVKKSRAEMMDARASTDWQDMLGRNRIKKREMHGNMYVEEFRMNHCAKVIQKQWRVHVAEKEAKSDEKEIWKRRAKSAREGLQKDVVAGLTQRQQLAFRAATERRKLGLDDKEVVSNIQNDSVEEAEEKNEVKSVDVSDFTSAPPAFPPLPKSAPDRRLRIVSPHEAPWIPSLPITDGANPLTEKQGKWTPPKAPPSRPKSLRKLRPKTNKRLDRLAQPVIRKQHLVREEAESRAEALRRTATAARMAAVSNANSRTSSVSGLAQPSSKGAVGGSGVRGIGIARQPREQSAKSSRSLSVTKATMRRIGMLMRTANAMKLVGMPVPEGVEEEMKEAVGYDKGEEGEAVAELLRSYSFTDAEFLSETQSMMEEHIVRDVGHATMAAAEEVPLTPPIVSLPPHLTSDTPSVPGKQRPTSVSSASAGEDPDSPEQHMLRAAKGYKEFDMVVERWLSDAGVETMEDLQEVDPRGADAVHMVAALHKMMSMHLHEAQSSLAARRREAGTESAAVELEPPRSVGIEAIERTEEGGSLRRAPSSSATSSAPISREMALRGATSMPSPVRPFAVARSDGGGAKRLSAREESNAQALASASALLHDIESSKQEASSPIGRLRELSNPLQLVLGTTHAVTMFRQELKKRNAKRNSSMAAMARSSPGALSGETAEAVARQIDGSTAEGNATGGPSFNAPLADSSGIDDRTQSHAGTASTAAQLSVSPSAHGSSTALIGRPTSHPATASSSFSPTPPRQPRSHVESTVAMPQNSVTSDSETAVAADPSGASPAADSEPLPPITRHRPEDGDVGDCGSSAFSPGASATASAERSQLSAFPYPDRISENCDGSVAAGRGDRGSSAELATAALISSTSSRQLMSSPSSPHRRLSPLSGTARKWSSNGSSVWETGVVLEPLGRKGDAAAGKEVEREEDALGVMAGVAVLNDEQRISIDDTVPSPLETQHRVDETAELLRSQQQAGHNVLGPSSDLEHDSLVRALEGTWASPTSQRNNMYSFLLPKTDAGADDDPLLSTAPGAASMRIQAGETTLADNNASGGTSSVHLPGSYIASRWENSKSPAHYAIRPDGAKNKTPGKSETATSATSRRKSARIHTCDGAVQRGRDAVDVLLDPKRHARHQCLPTAVSDLEVTPDVSDNTHDVQLKAGTSSEAQYVYHDRMAEGSTWWGGVDARKRDYSYSQGGCVHSIVDPDAGTALQNRKQRQRSAFYSTRHRRKLSQAVNMRCVPNAPSASSGPDYDDEALRHSLAVNHAALSAPTVRTDLNVPLPAFDARFHASHSGPTFHTRNKRSWRGTDDTTAVAGGVSTSCPHITGLSAAEPNVPNPNEAQPCKDSASGGIKLPTIPAQQRRSADSILLKDAGTGVRGAQSQRAGVSGEESKWTGPFRYLPARPHEPCYYSALMARPFGPMGCGAGGTRTEKFLHLETHRLMDNTRNRYCNNRRPHPPIDAALR